jgi:hypothetical protein
LFVILLKFKKQGSGQFSRSPPFVFLVEETFGEIPERSIDVEVGRWRGDAADSRTSVTSLRKILLNAIEGKPQITSAIFVATNFVYGIPAIVPLVNVLER